MKVNARTRVGLIAARVREWKSLAKV